MTSRSGLFFWRCSLACSKTFCVHHVCFRCSSAVEEMCESLSHVGSGSADRPICLLSKSNRADVSGSGANSQFVSPKLSPAKLCHCRTLLTLAAATWSRALRIPNPPIRSGSLALAHWLSSIAVPMIDCKVDRTELSALWSMSRWEVQSVVRIRY